MEYEPAIQAFEGERKKGPWGLFGTVSALIVRITPDSTHPLDMEMRHVNQHFMDWLARRGDKCADLVLEFIAAVSSRPEIEMWVSRLLLQDCQFNYVIRRLEVECTIQDPATGETLTLGASVWNPCAAALMPSQGTDPTPGTPATANLPTADRPACDCDDSPDLTAAIAEARRRMPEFKTLLNSAQAGVTVRIPWVCGDIRDIYEASLVGRDGDQLTVEFTPDYAPGPVRKNYRFEEILDWTVYHENGRHTGGFTARAIERLKSQGAGQSGDRTDFKA